MHPPVYCFDITLNSVIWSLGRREDRTEQARTDPGTDSCSVSPVRLRPVAVTEQRLLLLLLLLVCCCGVVWCGPASPVSSNLSDLLRPCHPITLLWPVAALTTRLVDLQQQCNVESHQCIFRSGCQCTKEETK